MTRSFTARHPRLGRVLATGFIVAVVCLVAVWVAPRASGAAAEWMRTPAVRLRTLAVPGDGSLAVAGPSARTAAQAVTLDAGMRFSMAGVVCDVPDGCAVNLRVRTSLDGATWGPWMETPLELADERGAARAFTDPLWTGPARFAQVAASAARSGGPAALTGVRLVAIDPAEDASVAARAEGTVRRLAATVAGVGVAPPASAASAAPAIVTRAEWGADESLRSGSPSYAPVKMAFVHHTASGNTYTRADAPALVRGIYAYHTSKSLGWSDIGYNFVIDRFGTIYEGRHGGIARGVVGAQVLGFNTGSTGISLMGTFSDAAPPAEAVAALERLLAWKLAVHGLHPAGTARLTCGATEKYKNGAVVTFPVIAGHRQANYTECPGAALYALLPTVRTAVARRMGATVVASLSASPAVISPNGDGILDQTRLDVSITTAADWRLTLRDAAGDAVASWSGQGATAVVTWSGTSGGADVPDGSYTAQLTATAPTGEAAAVTQTITVDTTAPRLTSVAAALASFSPNGDAQSETVELEYGPAEACDVRVGILDEDGDVLRWLHGWRARRTRSYSTAWDGQVTSGDGLVPAPDGLYRFDVERRDAAGNIARRGIKVTLDRTLGFPKAAPATFSPDGDGTRDQTAFGFRLTRRAAVSVTVRLGESTVRTLDLGTLEPGAHSAPWDGKDDSGEAVRSSRPTFTVTAVSTLGESAVSEGVVVDLSRPRLYAAGARTARPGTTTRLGFKASDAFSAQVDVRYAITNAKGRTVASGHPGWLPTGQDLSVTWKPKSRGVFTVTYRATDRGGNHELSPACTTVTVR